MRTYDEVAHDHGGEEERDAVEAAAEHAVPRRLDPLAAQHAEHDHERVQEVLEVPPRYLVTRSHQRRISPVTARYLVRKVLVVVVVAKHLKYR